MTYGFSRDDAGRWIEHAFTLEPQDDAWYVVEALSDTALGTPWRGSVPYAVTNAFFVDVAGDGWDAPGLL